MIHSVHQLLAHFGCLLLVLGSERTAGSSKRFHGKQLPAAAARLMMGELEKNSELEDRIRPVSPINPH